MASGHGVDKPRKENHPNRQVGRPAFGLGAAMDIRAQEYDDVRSGAMSREDAWRVGIDAGRVGEWNDATSYELSMGFDN